MQNGYFFDQAEPVESRHQEIGGKYRIGIVPREGPSLFAVVGGVHDDAPFSHGEVV